MKNLWIIEQHFSVDQNGTRYGLGDTEWYETFTDNKGELFRSLQKEHGRAGKMYIDTEDGPKQIGWVFKKRRRYADCFDTYIHEVWVSVSTTQPETRQITENITHPF